MKFGLWDHVDQSHLPLAELFDKRLEYVAAADDAGFYCYHVAEHHVTPLNMVPAPSVYLGAVARVTKQIRMGPLVYLVPLYTPLRLIEEICMLDHLSHGRFDIGIGRGISPYELEHFPVNFETGREVMVEALEAIISGLSNDKLNHSGEYYSYNDTPMELRPLQQPHPPVWYGSTSDLGSEWAGETGLNFVTLGSMEKAKRCVDVYQEAYAKRGAPLTASDDFPGGTAIGAVRHLVITDSVDEAVAIGKPAYDHWYASLTKLQRNNVAGPVIAKSMYEDVGEAVENGLVLVGPPDAIAENLENQIKELGINYLTLGFYFGTLPHEQAMRSLTLFADEVMPKLSHL
ncbi:MAG: LLM class flavin-dependent oxidoreductase [Rhodospirillales bacterium]|jgi:alkanesulfonate monooxygenase SsuD/methylene tetrahydromethanopterin reductase-like flavin-dependent oxidoreductase (luciferase family)|nr:hypothetical protein [Rhodospirillaceae bacterium]MDP6427347.1 LLM class flavin-dependent oxidoreductase [Rhodospirillales bacterium]MDP6643634.1 LLM class flavin-dependent oxidoreductase [Rhodospirillales bacterium]MDP6840237.1 LLM class flavin-dependent oxidoreductase [Rhodospirillales bacterium]|tara:strand:- start:1213 stop:2247 length:1035 start_codon:yes stop_codon:yes gene_type:complete